MPPDGGPAKSWESVRGVDNTTRDIFRKFFLSQRVTVARSRCPPGSLPCPCMAGSVSRSWVKVTGGASNLFKNFVLKCETWLGAQSLSGSAWIFTCGTFGDHHPPNPGEDAECVGHPAGTPCRPLLFCPPGSASPVSVLHMSGIAQCMCSFGSGDFHSPRVRETPPRALADRPFSLPDTIPLYGYAVLWAFG